MVSRQGQGTFVAERIEASPGAGGDRQRSAAAGARGGLGPARPGRSSPPPARACGEADEAPTVAGELPDLAEESEAIEVRHELRRQIARLEVELAAYTRDLPDDMPTAARFSKAHVAGVEELEQTRDTLIAQLSEAQRAAELRARQVGEARARREAQLERGSRATVTAIERGPSRQGDELVAGQVLSAGLPAREVRLRAGGGDDDPHREDGRLGGAAALSLRRGAGLAVPLRAQALLVPAADLDLRPLPRRSGLQAAGVLSLFGALDRLGGFFVLTAIRWIGPLVTAVVVAGVAGTAITADLGARKIREELDALQVLGVDPVKNLVVPRFLALMVITGAARHLRDRLRPHRRHRRRAALPAVARRLLRDPLLQRLGHRHLGLGPDVHDVRRDHRRRLLFQGDDRVGRGRGGRPRPQPGGRDGPRRGLLLPLRLHLDPARHQPRTAERSDDRLARRPRAAGSTPSARSPASARASPASSTAAASCASSARACARPAS